MEPQSACELSVQSATSSEGSADYMQKDVLTNTGSQSDHETPVQSVATNEKLVPSQKRAPTPQPVSLYKLYYHGLLLTSTLFGSHLLTEVTVAFLFLFKL